MLTRAGRYLVLRRFQRPPMDRAASRDRDGCRSALGFRASSASRMKWHAPSLEQVNAMPFRISRECCAGAPATFRLAGRLDGDAVEVLVDTCMNIAVGAIIDLAEVSYADDAGVKALGDLRVRGAVLRGSRPYLALILQQEDRRGT